MPDWVSQIQYDYPQDRLCHSGQVDLRSLQLTGERVLIIGGGLTSGHLAVGAIARGAKVLLMTRRNLQEKLFDADPSWLGPKYLKGFWAEPDLHNRTKLIQQARNGGSMTPAMMTQLRRLVRNDQLRIYEQCQVIKAMWQGNWHICDDQTQYEGDRGEREYEVDRIWLATGTKLNVRNHPLLKDILAAYPVPVVNNLPVLDDYLRWNCELFVMGGFAGLQIGPVARNLSGARMVSDGFADASRTHCPCPQ